MKLINKYLDAFRRFALAVSLLGKGLEKIAKALPIIIGAILAIYLYIYPEMLPIPQFQAPLFIEAKSA
jgi:hypothetical protein